MAGTENSEDERFAITTFGMNNHGIRTHQYRYIRYEDGGQELYDRLSDPNEWNNQAGNADYLEVIEKLTGMLPQSNRKWARHSQNTFQPYFVEQKERAGFKVTKN